MTLLQLHRIEKRFGATAALAGVDLEIGAGQVHALIGENGAGKSTLMNVLSGTVLPDSGVMTIGGARYAPRAPNDARRAGIAHIHQELALCPHLSVAENILLGTEPAKYGWLDRHALHARAAALLEEFGRGEIDPRTRTGDLALPDRQVVEICRALAWNARIILMDEPTSSLQRSNVERLFRVIRRLRERGLAIIYISHFLEEVREIADRYTVLRDGATVGSGDLAAVDDDALITMMVGRSTSGGQAILPVLSVPDRQDCLSSTVVLEVENLAAPPRLLAASFALHRGEVLGIAGLIGSGRTDLIRALFGLERATAGTIRVRGNTVAREDSSSHRIRSGFGYLSEDRKGEGLNLQLSVADNVTMTRLSSCARRGWIDVRRQAAQTEAVMSRLRIKARGPRSAVARLSGGNQQKVALGRLLHQDPDILLLDEPARGIDVGSKQDVYREVRRLADEGKAILMVSSFLPELLALCDRVAVMNRGRLSALRPAAEWSADSLMQAAVEAS